MDDRRPELVFLGTAACFPEVGNDTASFLIDGHILIDVGWHVTETLRRAGHRPTEVEHVLFTHFHHDHTTAFPALMFEFYMEGVPGPKAYGNAGIHRLLRDSDALLRKEVFWPEARGAAPTVIEAGETLSIGAYDVATLASDHAVPGLCYRFHHRESGVDFGFTGDTAYRPELADFFRGCALLAHEYSFGPRKDPTNRPRHSDARDAARVARDAGVGTLCLVHGPADRREECERAVRESFSGRLLFPTPNTRVLL